MKDFLKILKCILLLVLILYAFIGFQLIHSWFHAVGITEGERSGRSFIGKKATKHLILRPHFLWKYNDASMDLAIPISDKI